MKNGNLNTHLAGNRQLCHVDSGVERLCSECSALCVILLLEEFSSFYISSGDKVGGE
jgi:hypothetical protein